MIHLIALLQLSKLLFILTPHPLMIHNHPRHPPSYSYYFLCNCFHYFIDFSILLNYQMKKNYTHFRNLQNLRASELSMNLSCALNVHKDYFPFFKNFPTRAFYIILMSSITLLFATLVNLKHLLLDHLY
jgi:hypothetical protein